MPTLFRNASWSGIAAGFRAASGLFNALLAVRLLGLETYGHVATLLSLFVLYLSLNSGFFTVLVVKLMAPDAAQANNSVILASSAIFVALSIFGLGGITLLLSEFAPPLMSIEAEITLGLEIGHVMLLMGVITAIQIIAAWHSALIESVGRLDLAMKCQLLGPLIVLVLLATAFFAHRTITATEYMLALVAGALTDLFLLWFARRKVMKFTTFSWPTRQRIQGLVHLLRSGSVLQATSLMNMFLEPLNKLLLNHFVGAAAVTIYDLTMKVIWGIQYLFGATMRVFLHLGSQDQEAIGPTFYRVIALFAVPVVILHATGALFLAGIAHYWLSIDATQLMLFFAIATLSNLGMIFITPLYISLIGRGDLNFIFRCQAILAVTNVIVAASFVPTIGLIGAAFGLLAATTYNVLAIYARCKAGSETFSDLRQLLLGRRATYALTLLLFVAAILWGIKGGGNLTGILLIVLGLGAIMIREPIVGILLGRIGLKYKG